MASDKQIDVAYVANLARMDLSDAEIERFQTQLDDVVAWMDKIGQLDLSEVEPTAHAADLTNVMREDEVRPGIAQSEVLDNAPAQHQSQISVPRILE